MINIDTLQQTSPELYEEILDKLEERESPQSIAEDYEHVGEYVIRNINAREGATRRQQNDSERTLDPTIRS